MNILVIGNGGREHAIIWKLKQSPRTGKIYCTIGNAGICSVAECIDIKPEDIEDLITFVKENNIGFTVVGPEVPLSLGIVDRFDSEGLKVFGPSKNAAMLESSKTFAKDFMQRYNIPTAGFKKFGFEQKHKAIEYLNSVKYPVVIKADGLAAGKGVIIAEEKQSAEKTIHEIFDDKIFGNAGNSIVIEDFLTGSEASVFAICDGTGYLILPPAQDHKKILEGEKGKNTGGMGSFAPADKIVTDYVMIKVRERIIEPVLENMKKEGNEFKGCLYCGLMIDKNNDPYVIEFNVRFGDPETQVVIPKIESDYLEMLLSSAEGNIKDYKLSLNNNYYCSVVLASKGYPDKYESKKEITGLDDVGDNCIIFHAGTKCDNGKVLSYGGRVLNVVGVSKNNLKEAIDNAYTNVALINFENKYYRTDIAQKGLSH
jgi:phosphoribosylamine---glycine ligase